MHCVLASPPPWPFDSRCLFCLWIQHHWHQLSLCAWLLRSCTKGWQPAVAWGRSQAEGILAQRSPVPLPHPAP